MATNLYEILELAKDATPEQIRKAYKKKALKTHPDRLPGATPAEKAATEEQFRRVNNAYEVLSDPSKRREYDVHGVWPPPEPEQENYYPRASESRRRADSYHRRAGPFSGPFFDESFSDPFFGGHHQSSFASFAFSDPYSLFNSVFPEFFPQPRPTRYSHPHRSAPAAFEDPFEAMHRNMTNMMGGFDSMFPPMIGFGGGMPGMSPFPSAIEGPRSGSQARWASESYMSSTVNGVTTTVCKRRDFDGNEHVTRTYPDGREIRTINGVEQPSGPRGYISQPNDARPRSDSRHRHQRVDSRHLPPPPAVEQSHQTNPPNNAVTDYPMAPPPPYPTHTPGGYNGPLPDSRHRLRRSSDKNTYNNVNANPDYGQHDERHHRKKWWPRGW